ncbi:MAG: hypothetical protein ACJ788_28425 [Ktedonobacteraceae bacterium]
MDDWEHEQSEDDLDAQITPLDPPGTNIVPTLPRWFIFTRLSSRHYSITLRVAVVVSIILFTVVALPGSIPGLRTMMTGIYHSTSSTSIPGAVANEKSFYLDVSMPWTEVFVDGQPVRAPRINVDPPLKLGEGAHTIVWRAEPFLVQSCLVSVPFDMNDTCRFAPDDFDQQPQDSNVEVLLLHNSLFTLPIQQQTALIETVHEAFATYSATQLVQPGDIYAGPQGIANATELLQARLHFQFDPQAIANQSYMIGGEMCQQLCVVPWQYLQTPSLASSDTKAWLAMAFIYSSWSYTTAHGQVIAHDLPIDFAGAAVMPYPVLLRVIWDASGWQVQPLIGPAQVPPIVVSSGSPHDPATPADKIHLANDPACVAARDLLSGITYSNVVARFVSGPNPAAGCLAVIIGNGLNTPGVSAPPIAYFFEHLGVLLAMNPTAQKLLPHAPLASSYERSLAEQIASLADITIATA